MPLNNCLAFKTGGWLICETVTQSMKSHVFLSFLLRCCRSVALCLFVYTVQTDHWLSVYCKLVLMLLFIYGSAVCSALLLTSDLVVCIVDG